MTIKALVYGGKQVIGIAPPTVRSQYDGIWFEMRGATPLENGRHVPAGLTVEMSYQDALDFIMALYLAVEKHGEDANKAPAKLVERLQRRVERKMK